MIQFNCSECGRHYRISDDHVGKRVRCKPCGTINQIPVTSSKDVGHSDSLAAFNNLLQELSQCEKKAPTLETDS